MKTLKKILCPVDLSGSCRGAIGIATQLAKQNDAKVYFIYVEPRWSQDEAILGSKIVHEMIEADKKEFEQIRPTDVAVSFEHIFIRGNAGPEIVKASKSMDIIVISSHGRTGLMRLIMGSVAQYVLRNSKCPVVMIKGFFTDDDNAADLGDEQRHFITEVMHHVAPIHAFDKMDDVLAQLEKANETAAPVVDGAGCCIGILTSSDIEHYHVLLERFAARDETVVDEMFEVDQFGQRRADNLNFDQVERHMTKELISIRNDQSIADAIDLFEANPNIHHLVVVDEDQLGIGIVDSNSVIQMQTVESED